MSGVINVIGRLIGEDDISFGANSYVFVDTNGTVRRLQQVNAESLPWKSIPDNTVEAIVNGSKSVPVGASSLAVVGTSVLSGYVYGSGVASGYVKNHASGLLVYAQTIATGDIPSGIPASSVGSGTVGDAVFGYLAGATSNLQAQINTLSGTVGAVSRLQYYEPPQIARLRFVDATTCSVLASTDSPALVMMNGFPNVLNPQQFVDAGLSDSVYRRVTSSVSLVFPANMWGSETNSQWYAVYAYATAGTAELSAFSLKAMPYLRMRNHAAQQIKCGTCLDATAAVDYAFTGNEFVDGYIYVLTGTDAGQLRLINGNDTDGGASRISYLGAALALTQGDWFVILPPGLAFRRIGDIYNDSAGDIEGVVDIVHGYEYHRIIAGTAYYVCPLTLDSGNISLGGSGGGGTAGAGGRRGESLVYVGYTLTAGVIYSVLIPTAALTGADGGPARFNGVLTATGGIAGASLRGASGEMSPGSPTLSGSYCCYGGDDNHAAEGNGYFWVTYNRDRNATL